ncbi:MAG: type VI secretion system baseplate subunit TssG [Chitinivibrionales bacterium]
MADLINRLGNEGRAFSFFQAVSLLEEYFKKKQGVAEPIDDGHIRFSSSSSVSFPSGDIESVDAAEDLVHFTLTFMGMCGVSSPLPHYFSEFIAHHDKENTALSDFLALFNHRLYTLFFRAWKKYRFAVDNPQTLQRLCCLAGLYRDHKSRTGKKDSFMLAYTGLLASKCRSAAGLESMLSHRFGAIPVRIRQWVPQWTKVGAQYAIGKDACLGVNTMVGTHVYDISGKFRVLVGPLPREQFEQFVSGTQNIAEMKRMIREYTADPLDFDIEVWLEALDLIPAVLGEEDGRLGVTSSLGTSDTVAGEYSIRIN